MTQGDGLPSNTSAMVSTTPLYSNTTVDRSEDHPVDSPNKRPVLTDTLAAVTIAVLAVILVLTLTLIVRAVRRRRRQERGEQMDTVPTVTAGIISANVAAYRRDPRPPERERGVISWEPVPPAHSSTQGATSSSSS